MEKITRSSVVERMKRQILDDVVGMRVPVNVKSFGDLHDYVDANEYGGFCEEAFINQLESLLKAEFPDEDDPVTDFFNSCQEEVHCWLRDGGLEKLVQDTRPFIVSHVVLLRNAAPMIERYSLTRHKLDHVRSLMTKHEFELNRTAENIATFLRERK